MNINSFNAMKVFKTKVTRSQRNGKDNAKIIHCPWVAGKRLMADSVINNLNLEEYMFTSKIKISTRVQNLLYKRTTKWENLCISCLFGDFNVYGSPLCSNICLSH